MKPACLVILHGAPCEPEMMRAKAASSGSPGQIYREGARTDQRHQNAWHLNLNQTQACMYYTLTN